MPAPCANANRTRPSASVQPLSRWPVAGAQAFRRQGGGQGADQFGAVRHQHGRAIALARRLRHLDLRGDGASIPIARQAQARLPGVAADRLAQAETVQRPYRVGREVDRLADPAQVGSLLVDGDVGAGAPEVLAGETRGSFGSESQGTSVIRQMW